jgi:large subunit ribosomal protein L3
MKEFRVSDDQVSYLERGAVITASVFAEGDMLKITGTSKGKGFAGVVKRHKFAGQDATHGTKDQLRMPGSIGAGGPSHVFKGLRGPGQMGNEQVTVDNLQLVKIDAENNLMYVKGAVPGGRNGIVTLVAQGDMDFSAPVIAEEIQDQEAPVEEAPSEEAVSETSNETEKVEVNA